MSANDYIAIVRRRNPKIADVSPSAKMTFTIREFEKHLAAAFEAGRVAGEESKSTFEKLFGKI